MDIFYAILKVGRCERCASHKAKALASLSRNLIYGTFRGSE